MQSFYPSANLFSPLSYRFNKPSCHLIIQTSYTIINIMQPSRNNRRKRKDAESRDFTCKCGKSYLSYAAAYTHVKNKHQLEKTYLIDITKPQRQKLPRGRPKQKKQQFSSTQIEQLSILQESILKIYQLLNDKFQGMILEGNSSLTQSKVVNHLNDFIASCNQQDQKQLSHHANGNRNRFTQDLNRHFSSQMRARVILVVNMIIQQQQVDDQQQEQGIVWRLNGFDFWKGTNEVNTVIYDTYKRWQSLQA